MKSSWAKMALWALIASALVVPAAAWAGPDDATCASCPHGKNMEQKINAMADRVTQKLGLTPAQRTLFVDMKTAEFKVHALKRQSAAAADVEAARVAAEKAKDAFIASLSAEQKQKWETMHDEMKDKMKHKWHEQQGDAPTPAPSAQ